MTESQLIRRERCPECAAQGRDVSEDNLAIYDDGHSYCYACSHFIPKEGSIGDEFTYEYLPWRGINASALITFDAKTKVDKDGKPVSIGFRYPNGSYKVRLIDQKQFYSIGDISSAGLYGRDRFPAGSHKYVTITEGELDAISLWQVLRSPVVSIQGASSASRDCSGSGGDTRSWLQSFERVYLCFDNDTKGREAKAAVAKLFDFNKVYDVRLERKDANEYLQHGEEEQLRNIWWNAKRYLPETIVSSFQDFAKILQETNAPGVPYPFPTLNELTYGIRRGESVLLTAQEGVGKTELMHAIEYQLLRETNDNIGAIYLEEPKRRHLQALAGLQLKRPIHLPDYGCSPAEEVSALEKAIGQDERLHLYSHFGSDDPEVLLDTIRFMVGARSCVFVLLDHVSMVVSGLSGDDERRALDYIATRLEMMVKELNFALIMVSHVNDFGQTRGSRYLSKIADIRIDAKRDVMATDPIVRNTTLLTVPKNRFSGKTGFAGNVLFDPLTLQYKELPYVEAPQHDPSFEALPGYAQGAEHRFDFAAA